LLGFGAEQAANAHRRAFLLTSATTDALDVTPSA
jgi:hypothetical protein